MKPITNLFRRPNKPSGRKEYENAVLNFWASGAMAGLGLGAALMLPFVYRSHTLAEGIMVGLIAGAAFVGGIVLFKSPKRVLMANAPAEEARPVEQD